MNFWHGIIFGIGISAFIVLVATLVSRDPDDRPAATRREIKRDRKGRIADITRATRATRPPTIENDERPSGIVETTIEDRLTGEIANLGDRYQQPAGWQDRTLAAARVADVSRRCATCGIWLSKAHNARLMPSIGVGCFACATSKERPNG